MQIEHAHAQNQSMFVLITGEHVDFTARIGEYASDGRWQLVDKSVSIPFYAYENDEKSVYVKLATRTDVEAYMNIEDFIDRTDPDTGEDMLKGDFVDLLHDRADKNPAIHYLIQTEEWEHGTIRLGQPLETKAFDSPGPKTRSGGFLSLFDLTSGLDQTNELALNQAQQYLIDNWMVVATETIAMNRQHLDTTKDVINVITARFFNPFGDQVQHFQQIRFSVRFRSDLQTLLEAPLEQLFKTLDIISMGYDFVSYKDEHSESWAKWFEHPLGFYAVLMEPKSYKYLVMLQTNDCKLHRDFPEPHPVAEFAEKIGTVGYRLAAKNQKYAPLAQVSRIENNFDPNPEPIKINGRVKALSIKRPRRATTSIMGQSANKWARDVLKWNEIKPGQPVAEWMHRRAHSFGEATANRFRNLVFGTRECNTQMIRAENVVKALSESERVVEVTVQTFSKNEPFGTTEGYHSWLTRRLNYEISYTIKTGPGNMNLVQEFKHTCSFNPMSRLIPLHLEAQIDEVVMNAYLENAYRT